MSAVKFNVGQLKEDALTFKHITKLVEFWQRHHDLVVDGYVGDSTLDSILPQESLYKVFPLRLLTDGREPRITSKFYTENKGRSRHKGVDFFYRWLDSDPEVYSGHGGAIKKRGNRRWWYPDGAIAVAAACGVVQKASITKTGFRVWIDHGNGERTGYFHGAELLVAEGDKVVAGTPVIVVGDNPNGGYKKHLHFEVSPVDRYAPTNPRKWLEDAVFLPATS